MMLLHADGTHETVTIRACGTTRGGLPVVLVDGAAFVVAEVVKPPIHIVADPDQPADNLWDVAIQESDNLGRIRTAPEDADTSDRGLTHSPDSTRKGLA